MLAVIFFNFPWTNAIPKLLEYLKQLLKEWRTPPCLYLWKTQPLCLYPVTLQTCS